MCRCVVRSIDALVSCNRIEFLVIHTVLEAVSNEVLLAIASTFYRLLVPKVHSHALILLIWRLTYDNLSIIIIDNMKIARFF